MGIAELLTEPNNSDAAQTNAYETYKRKDKSLYERWAQVLCVLFLYCRMHDDCTCCHSQALAYAQSLLQYCSSAWLVGAEHLLLYLQESEGASQEVCRVITRKCEAWAMRKNTYEGPVTIHVLQP